MATSLSSASSNYYTIRRVAAMLSVEEWRVHRAIRRGVLRPIDRHGRPVIAARDLTRLLGGGGR
ncbi:helix-turn-helix domain-containing protein [Sciscionella marina]|uniref:helix-turn-helix domain-containing protein n=1 Tax=Sciscionella marina TaxID=508770 RepID=UPI000A07034A|nr:helix-turn-helix domain-containing protein [Sciscionella marina]